MPCIPIFNKRHRRIGFLAVAGDYKPGDPPPGGYCDWHEWARVQVKARLKQRRCGRCGLLQFPQELARTTETEIPLCFACVEAGEDDG